MNKNMYIFSQILLILGTLLFFGILCAIGNERTGKNKQREYIFYGSKILTVKAIVNNSHYSEIFNSFSSSGEVSGITSNYKNLLKLTTKDGCVENYKKCGILDTIGNFLCIDEFFDCPINTMKISSVSRANDYLSKNYQYTSIEGLSYNNRLYYSNNDINGDASVILLQTEDEPKYLTTDNFILDMDIYKEIYGDTSELLEFFGSNKDDDSNSNDDNNKEIIKNLIQIVSSEDPEIELIAGTLIPLLSYYENKQFEDFQKYVEKRLKEDDNEDNIDINFKFIGDNYYTKNYIGFRNIQDIKKFMNFDYNIYKKIFPNKTAYIFAIICAVIIITFLILPYVIAIMSYSEENKINFICLHFTHFIMNFMIMLGFFIYAIITYFKVNKNEALSELKSIKSDEFINNFIEEFTSKCEKSTLILSTMIIIGITFSLHIISIIIICLGDKCD